MKKKILIAFIAILVMVGVFFLVKRFINKFNLVNSIKNDEIVSTIYLDINPSLAIDLDKNNKVLDVRALNDDAKKIIDSDYKDKEYNFVIHELVENLVNNGYAEDKLTILVSTAGELVGSEVSNVIEQELTSKNISFDIVVQKISDKAYELSEKYGISESKAAYIEEMIDDNGELSFEELKNKSIEELNEIKNKQVDYQKEEVVTTTKASNNGSNTSNNKSNNDDIDYGCNPPANITDNAWCDWNVKRHQNCEYNYPGRKDGSELSRLVYAHLGIPQSNSVGAPVAHPGATYCQVYKFKITYGEYAYTVEIDEVTGEIVSSTKEKLSFKMTEAEAKQKGLAFWRLAEEDCENVWVTQDLNGSANGAYYRFQVNIMTKDNKNYSVDYNAMTGEVMGSRSW